MPQQRLKVPCATTVTWHRHTHIPTCIFIIGVYIWGFPGGTSGKELTGQCRRLKRHEFSPWVGKIPWRRKWLPTSVFLPGEFHGQRNLVGYSPWGRKELDTTEWLTRTYLLSNLNKSHLSIHPLSQHLSNFSRPQNHLEANPLALPQSFWCNKFGVRPVICISRISQVTLWQMVQGPHFENHCPTTQCRVLHIKRVQ